jgi:uncharacterized protein Yka (UPF0111/DUF47 family)
VTLAERLYPAERQAAALIAEAIRNALRAADRLNAMLADYPASGHLAREVLICEQHGDRITRDLYRLVYGAQTWSLEPRKLTALATTVDDIVDAAEQAADCFLVYKLPDAREEALRLALLLLDQCRLLADAAARAVEGRNPSLHTAGVRRLAGDGQRLARRAGAELTHRERDPLVVVCWKDVYASLASALAAGERAAELLEDIAAQRL